MVELDSMTVELDDSKVELDLITFDDCVAESFLCSDWKIASLASA